MKKLLLSVLCLSLLSSPVFAKSTVSRASGGSSFSSSDFVDDLNSASFADDQIFVADDVSGGTPRTLTDCTDSAGQHLNYTQSTNSFSCGTSASTPGGWTDGGTDITLTTTTDNVGIGGASLGKFSIDGDTDESQFVVQMHSTQTSNGVVFEKSDGTDLFTWANDGTYTQSGSATPSMSLGGGTPATYPITFSLSGSNDPVLTAGDAYWKWAAAGEDLTSTFSSNTLTVSSSTGVSNIAYTSMTLSPTNIAAHTATGSVTLAENSTLALDPAGSADGKYTGVTVTATAGYSQTYGDLVYLDPTDSRWEAVDANSAAAADGDARGIIGIVVSAGTDGNACTILLSGIIRADAKFPTFTVNNPIYISETAAAVTQTQPTTTDVVIRIVGAALTTDEMYFNPDNTWTTHT